MDILAEALGRAVVEYEAAVAWVRRYPGDRLAQDRETEAWASLRALRALAPS